MIKKLLVFFFKNAFFSTRKKYKRILPFGDYICDRWEKAKFIGFGDGSSIYDSSLVFDNVTVGKNVWVGPFTILDGSGGNLSIGDNTHVSAGVQIYTHDTVAKVIYNQSIEKDNVIIGKNCYIGPNTIISKGVKIGDNVIIGANSFVNKDIPSFTKGYGTPFKVVKNIN